MADFSKFKGDLEYLNKLYEEHQQVTKTLHQIFDGDPHNPPILARRPYESYEDAVKRLRWEIDVMRSTVNGKTSTDRTGDPGETD